MSIHQIPYSYEIIKVDSISKCMEIVYSSEGRQSIHIGARLPYIGESLESIVKMYAPISFWEEQELTVQEIQQGVKGNFEVTEAAPVTLESTKTEKLQEIASWRYNREVAGITLNGSKIKTDRESQAMITAAFISISQGLVTSVDWKSDNGVWLTLGLPEMSAIAGAVASHVQQCFTLEKLYVNMVAAATTIEDVQAIQPANVTHMSAM
jgi:hypothetical protein